MKLKNPPNLKHCRLCGKHFIDDCYEPDRRSELLGSKKVKKLKNDAVPTLFDFSSYNMVTGKKVTKKLQINPKMSEKLKTRLMRIKVRDQKKFLKKVRNFCISVWLIY